ncbi:MAG: hypothetical protein A4S09_00575 [Proteobacteria bacterium SG_bin7]|nr:MAG: hypothetical protein A4S09_00575 [Proteobacteria bacterium SG_bin7]
MKILAVSLLRLGDILMTSGVLRALKEKNPGSELHLLINRQFGGVSRLLIGVDKIIFFDRDRAQRGMGEFEHPLFDSYDYFKEFIEELNANDYAQVYNFSQNLFSARLMGLLDCPIKVGMTIDMNDKATFGSEWFEKLNRRNLGEPVHYIDYMARGCGVSPVSANPSVQISNSRVNKFFQKKYIAIQALTNEEKKNWGIGSWAQMVRFVARKDPSLDFVFLAAPSEEAILIPEVQNLKDSGVRAEICVCDLSEAAAILESAELVITGDTSIKHLATAVDAKVLELSLGSSDFHFTGTYSDKSYIYQGNVACAPCSPGGSCSQKRKYCAESIHPHTVSQIALAILNNEDLRYFENLYRGKFLANGLWTAELDQENEAYDVGVIREL